MSNTKKFNMLRYSLFIDLDIAFFEPVLSIPQPEEENKLAYKNAYIYKSLLIKSMMRIISKYQNVYYSLSFGRKVCLFLGGYMGRCSDVILNGP